MARSRRTSLLSKNKAMQRALGARQQSLEGRDAPSVRLLGR
jgi:hypothetical protein